MNAGNRAVTVRFFASIKEIFGQKEAAVASDQAPTVGKALRQVCTTPERERGIFLDGYTLRSDLIVLVNGRNVFFLGGLAATLHDGDVVSIFPPVKGG